MVNIPIAQQEFSEEELLSLCENIEKVAPKHRRMLRVCLSVGINSFIMAMLHQLASRAGHDFANYLYDYGPVTIKVIIRLILLFFGHNDPSIDPLMC